MRNENRALVNHRSLLTLLMILAGVISLTILATVVGWFSTYVVPLAVLLVAAVVVVWFLVAASEEAPRRTRHLGLVAIKGSARPIVRGED